MATATPANPYPGLRAFEADERELFFGRERETDELRRRLRTTRLLAVVGSSGSGKSSLVRSGLIPSLHSGFMAGVGSSWRVAITRPGEDPIGRLVAALDRPELLGVDETHADTRRTVLEVMLRDSSLGLAETVRQAHLPAGDNVLVVVDQFEELFRYRRSRMTRAEGDDAVTFVRLLLEAARCPGLPIYVVLTMRSEFIGECVAFDGLAEAINVGQYLVPRMSRDALRTAISGPAAVRGVAIVPRLLVRLLNEVGDELDSLPVLQHALMRSWDAWAHERDPGEPLDLRHYEAIGTMKQALSRHAEEAYAGLDGDHERRIAERMFKALTETTEDGHGMRRPTALRGLAAVCEASMADVEHVIERFRAPGRAFLQPPAGVKLQPQDIVDLVHESLMRLWDRLVGWVREEARAEGIYRSLVRSAAQHAAGEVSLWRSPELEIGLRWLQENRPSAAWAGGDPATFEQAMGFLQASRRAHRLKVGAFAASVVMVVVLTIAWAGLQQAIAEKRHKDAVVLEGELKRLKEDTAVATAERNRRVEEVLTLREHHGALTARVDAVQRANDELQAMLVTLREANRAQKAELTRLEEEKKRLESTLMTLREANRALEAELAWLQAERARLHERNHALDAAFDSLLQEARDLADSTSKFKRVAPKLEAQLAELRKQVDTLRERNEVLAQLKSETEPCPDEVHAEAQERQQASVAEPAAGAGAGGGGSASAASAGEAMSEPSAVLLPTSVTPPDTDFDQELAQLRHQIIKLLVQVAALSEEKASLQEEAARLTQANALLDGQLEALNKENALLNAARKALQQENTRLDRWREVLRHESARLEQERATLERKQRELREAAERAVAERQRLAVYVETKEKRNQRRQDEVDTARQERRDLARRVDELTDAIGTTNNNADRLRADNQHLVDEMTGHVERLLQAARSAQAPADLAALLALKAWRWAPYDTDDGAHPAVYNTLWLVLDRFDEAGAGQLIAPGDGSTGKLATTRTNLLAGALCERVTRPLTEAEWRQFLPKGACFTNGAAQPCAR